jgi:hypothetical protein
MVWSTSVQSVVTARELLQLLDMGGHSTTCSIEERYEFNAYDQVRLPIAHLNNVLREGVDSQDPRNVCEEDERRVFGLWSNLLHWRYDLF